MEFVTVIICTYNRGNLLAETLPTILEQDDNRFKVLIVDNNSTDNTNSVVNEFAIKHQNLEFIIENNQGASFARNTGCSEAKTEWIIFLDDDAKVPNSFINNAIDIIKASDYDCIGGIYYPWYKYEKPKWFKDKYASTAVLFENDNVAPQHTYISAGIMAIKKDVLTNVGGFSTSLGPSGSKMNYGEETNLHDKLIKNGYKVKIEPSWFMYHLVDQNKYRLKWFRQNGSAIGKDYWSIYNDQPNIKKILRFLIHSIRSTLANTKQLFKSDYRIQNWLVENVRILSFEFHRQLSGYTILFRRDK